MSEDEGKGEDDRNVINQPNGNPNINTTAARDLGHVTAEVQDEHEGAGSVKKVTACLSSSWVGARRSLGRSPASSWVGRPAGGARALAPVFGRSLHSQELEDDLYRPKSLASYATLLSRQRRALR